MVLTLLTTKISVPPLPLNIVPRERLLVSLREGLKRKLTLISAPAGFGKTTLLSQWIATPGYSPNRVVWLSLDARDNDPHRFWRYFLGALNDLKLGHAALGLQEPLAESINEDELVAEISKAAADIPEDFAFVLDDYHLISAQSIHSGLAFLLENLPPHLHLFLVSRVDPPFPLAQMRIRGQLLELRAKDLRFDQREAQVFLRDIMDVPISSSELEALAERTEGWIAGLQLAGLSIRDRIDLPGFIQHFTGKHHLVEDYLAEQVLDQQPEEIQKFLLKTSILDRLSGPLCDAILDEPASLDPSSSQKILETLERANLFLVPLDTDRQWYRYHHLFADFLRNRLNQAQPSLWLGLHQRAAEWFESKGMLEEAVQHALEAENYELGADLMEKVADKLYRRNEVFTMLNWLKALPEEFIRLRPALCVIYAWTLAFSGQVDAVEPYLKVAENAIHASQALETSRVGSELDSTVTGTIDNIRSYIARFRGNLNDAIWLSQRALEQTPVEQLSERSIRLILLGRAQYLEGNLSEASRNLGEACRATRSAGPAPVYLNAVHYLGELYRIQGNLHQAYELYQDALRHMEEQVEPVYAGVEWIGLGNLFYEWNDLATAARYLEEGQRLAERGGDYIFRRDATLACARLAQAEGDLEKAFASLEKVKQLVLRNQTSVDLPLVEAWRAHLMLVQGDWPAAQHWVAASGLSPADELSFVREPCYLTLARILLAQRDFENAGLLLDRLFHHAQAGGRLGRILSIRLLQAQQYQAMGETAEALIALQQAVAAARPEGYLRTFIDEGASIAHLLAQFCRAKPESSNGHYQEEKEYAQRILGEFAKGGIKGDPVFPAAVEDEAGQVGLSERELQVLRLIAAGKSYQEISKELLVALSTVQTHVKHVYTKLNAHSGLEATARARQLNLIP